MRSFKKALNDVIQSRRAIANMNSLYPNATAQDLQESDNICIICREEMVGTTIINGQVINPGSGLSKKLPCGHIFHVSCLRSWFQRQQTCPTCRLDVLRASVASRGLPNNNAGVNAAVPNAVPLQPQNVTPAAQLNPQQQHFLQQVFMAQFMLNQFGGQTPAADQPAPPVVPPAGTESRPASQATSAVPVFPGPMPSPPPDLSHLSDEDLLMLIRTERQGLEARLKLYSQSRTLVDAAINNLLQFNAALSSAIGESADIGQEQRTGVSIPTELVPTAGGRFLSDEETVRKRSNSAIRRARVNKFSGSPNGSKSSPDASDRRDGAGNGEH